MSRAPIADVLVAVPTLGRRDLAPLLGDLASQSGAAAVRAGVLVLDNGRAPSSVVRTAAETVGAAYVHVGTPGVASVRNAALDHASSADAVVFIDDDERPVEGWLDAMLAAAAAHDADVVLGPVPVRVPADAPRWVGDGSVLRDVDPHAYADGPYAGPVNAGNTLVRADLVTRTSTRFDPAYDATGGEDTVFFATLRAHGATVVWASKAVAFEVQDADRLTLRGYARRLYEAGQRAVIVEKELNGTTASQVATRRSGRIARGAATVVGGAATLRPDRAARGLGDVAFGVGSLTALAGRRPSTYGN